VSVYVTVDCRRVFLLTRTQGRNDYINAVFVPVSNETSTSLSLAVCDYMQLSYRRENARCCVLRNDKQLCRHNIAYYISNVPVDSLCPC